MNKGWKSRIHERIYFEEKKEQREAKHHFMKALSRQVERDMREYLSEMKEKNATH